MQAVKREKPSMASLKNGHQPGQAPEELYLDLMKKCLTRFIFGESRNALAPSKTSLRGRLYEPVRRLLASRRLELVRKVEFDAESRADGKDWPSEAETMIGLKRLDDLQRRCVDVIQRGIPGDFAETGVWRGGASIFMRAVLQAYQEPNRVVWVADSFQGLPKPDAEKYPADKADRHWEWSEVLGVPLEAVQANFRRYSLLDDRVKFLVGWFKDTLPVAPIEKLAVLRLDGDMYESTMDALQALYPKVSVGGYVVIDDYGAVPGCRTAVDEYRQKHGIVAPLEWVDWAGVVWKREA